MLQRKSPGLACQMQLDRDFFMLASVRDESVSFDLKNFITIL
jgi:hypothetical protein